MINSTIRLGRVGGVPIGAHWSLILIGALLSMTLATGLLPATVDASVLAYWLAAALGTFSFFASILVHELAHSLVARRRGVPVDDITLWALGGLARLGGDAPDASAQLRIALAGPITSLLAAVAFGASALAGDGLAVAPVVVVTLAWLALVNVVLAAFNMLPGAPLDGGRVLEAVLWMRHGDRYRAAVSAARSGRVVGYTLIALGLTNVLLGIGFGSLWTTFIGWFIVAASSSEEQSARMRGALATARVVDIMDRSPAVLPEWLTVDVVINEGLPLGQRVALLQRLDGGDISGLVTERQLLSVPRAKRGQVRLIDIGSPKRDIRAVAPSASARSVLDELSTTPVVVIDHGQVMGLISFADAEGFANAR